MNRSSKNVEDKVYCFVLVHTYDWTTFCTNIEPKSSTCNSEKLVTYFPGLKYQYVDVENQIQRHNQAKHMICQSVKGAFSDYIQTQYIMNN